MEGCFPSTMSQPNPTIVDYSFNISFLSGTNNIEVEPVGRWFKAWWYHHQRNGALSGEGLSFAESGSQSDEEAECSAIEIEDDVDYLRSLDPKEWKVSN